MPDSSAIDAAVVAHLSSDATLLALVPNGVYVDEAPPNATRFVIVSLITAFDEAKFGGRAYEEILYLVEARMRSTAGGDIRAAAARIDELLEDREFGIGSPPDVNGYSWMTCHRVERVRMTEVDFEDASIRWHRRGGRYLVQMAVNA